MLTSVAHEIERATREVFTSMVGSDIAPEALSHNPCNVDTFNFVASLPLSGSVQGAAQVRSTLPVATCITCNLLEAEPPLEPETILDAVGEVANMIMGNVKNSLETQWGSIRIGIPRRGTIADLARYSVSLTVHFQWRGDVFSVSIAFQPAVGPRDEHSWTD